MGGILKDRWSVPSTAVAHEFIDGYMGAANGEYVKVYLYVLRHQGEDITIEHIADALNHTESDVRRALLYWERLGVLLQGGELYSQADPVTGTEGVMLSRDGGQPAGNHDFQDGALKAHGLSLQAMREQSAAVQDSRKQSAVRQDIQKRDTTNRDAPKHNEAEQNTRTQNRREPGTTVREPDTTVREPDTTVREPGTTAREPDTHSQAVRPARESTIEVREAGDLPVYSAEQVNRLSQDEEFSQLLYIAQKYMDRVFTPRDCQAFAYLYEDLGMGGELLEYLVEYCVQNGHTSVRYIEAVARNWHEKDIHTVREAKEYSASYNKDSFAVMKAFGINSRKPAAPEQKLMDKWFRDYGFTREVVLEACGRTITAIHNPSFQYADKILEDWKKLGIHGPGDIKELDARRLADKEQNAQSRDKRLQKYDTGVSSQGGRARKGAPNQFHNFEQRDTDYDALMLKQVKEWVGQ